MPIAKAKKPGKTARKPAPKTAKKVTLDDVWATMRELQELHKENELALKEARKENELALKEMRQAHQETEQTLKKSQDEAWKAIKEAQRHIFGVSNTLGSLVEHIMTPDLPRKFKQFGFTFDRVTTVKWAVEGSIYTQIDGLLENGAQAMVVEVKTTLRQDDIDEHLNRMEKVRKYADEHGDKRQFLGAMAATIINESVRQYALKKGFFVIEPSGEDVRITKPVSDPKIW
jgi:hypothetical protein